MTVHLPGSKLPLLGDFRPDYFSVLTARRNRIPKVFCGNEKHKPNQEQRKPCLNYFQHPRINRTTANPFDNGHDNMPTIQNR